MMRRSLILATLLVSFVCRVSASDGQWSVLKISPEMLKNCNAVVRLDEMKVEVKSSLQLSFRNHYVITILNENGDKWADMHEYYDKLQDIESIDGFLYDRFGKEIKKVKKKDISDLSGNSDGSFMDDNRIKFHNFYYKLYPYTIEYVIETSSKSSMFFPAWSPQSDELVSVEKSSMQISCPTEYKFRYKGFNYEKAPIVTNNKQTTDYLWSVEKLPAISKESYSPLWHEITPYVIFGPTEFRVDNYKGNMISWEELGKFMYELKKGRDELPPATIQAVNRIAASETTTVGKIQKLYEFLQKNTRYVSIQLGIGGWQPFDATSVATKGYGDCKALTNYMYSMLKASGIKSYYTLIRAGSGKNYITSDFPSSQFNHVILCVPLEKDTVWLECTSQDVQAGYMGDFTSDRDALIVDETNSKLVHTPKYSLEENAQVRKINAKLDAEGNLVVLSSANYGGLQQDELHSVINHLSKEKVKEYLHNQLDLPTYDVDKFNYTEGKSAHPEIEEKLEIYVSHYATITGKRLFINPNIMSRATRKLSQDTARKYDIRIGMECVDIDSVDIEIPEGFEPEAIPADLQLKSEFGTYTVSAKLQKNHIIYYRKREQFSGKFPAASFANLAKFANTIYKSDRNTIVLVKKTN